MNISMNFIKKIMLITVMQFIAISAFASVPTPKPGANTKGEWVVKDAKKVTLDDVVHETESQVFSNIIELTMRQQNTVNGSSQVLESVVQKTIDKEERKKLGHAMYERVKKSKGGVAGILGAAAVEALIEGVGWVMEEGVYVKKISYKPDDPNNNAPMPDSLNDYLFCPEPNMLSCQMAQRDLLNAQLKKLVESISNADKAKVNWKVMSYDIREMTKSSATVVVHLEYDLMTKPEAERRQQVSWRFYGTFFFNSNPPNNETQTKTIKLTDEQVGDLMVGDYTDPVDAKYNKKDNKWTAPKEVHSFQRDPEVGNEPAQDAQNRAENDPNKRIIDDGTKPKPDPENPDKEAVPTQLPAFCDWAKIVCDWIDWTQEEPEKDDGSEQPDIDDQGIFSKTFDYVFSLSKQCPPDIPIDFETKYISGSFTFSLKWLCMIFTFLGYPIVFASHCTGIWILYEAVIRKEFRG